MIAALSLATDLGVGLPFEHGLQSTLVALRLAERLDVDSGTASDAYYGCLLFYIGCTADADLSAELFAEGALFSHFNPVAFGSPLQIVTGIMHALADPDAGLASNTLRIAGRLPRAIRGHQAHITALCEVAVMLTDRLGLPASVRDLFRSLIERWDGKGQPDGLRGEDIPLPLRIMHVARDAIFQQLVGGTSYAAGVTRERAGHAFDPRIAHLLADEAEDILAFDDDTSAWSEVLDREPGGRPALAGTAIDDALAAIADFSDLISPYLVGHSSGVAELAASAGRLYGLSEAAVVALRRAALVHDVGRVGVSTGIWQKSARLTEHEREQVRLHAYHSERVLCRSPFLAAIAPVATAHHERLDGSGYHRGTTAAALTPPARLLAAADAYHAMTEPRPYREALTPTQAADVLGAEARAGRLDAASADAVLAAAGHQVRRLDRPAGLTDREIEVVALLARGLPTKQIARTLGISVKTADRHLQNAYPKIGVSSRAAAALFAMEHGLIRWGEFPIAGSHGRS
ncbi:HD domain-containing protein [Kribbella antiqua]|uniref:HD domain-containing protein n=1 Tax=Kribbella antiqua TaxID=2512217 RepID=A0A4R2J5H4_9ACTN|nr:HD domain-containing protein [Kribbella antiqua]